MQLAAMPLSAAQTRAWNLAQALMIPMIVIQTDDEDFAVIESRDVAPVLRARRITTRQGVGEGERPRRADQRIST